MEHYEDIADIKRVVVHTNLLTADVSGIRIDRIDWANLLSAVARRLLWETYRREHARMLQRNAASQHQAELTSRGSIRYEVL